MTKAQALAQGITLCRWRNMRYRTEHGKQRLDAYCWNACRARKFNRARPIDYMDYIRQAPATSAVDRRLKRALQWERKLNRQLKIELHCRQMRAARRAAKNQ